MNGLDGCGHGPQFNYLDLNHSLLKITSPNNVPPSTSPENVILFYVTRQSQISKSVFHQTKYLYDLDYISSSYLLTIPKLSFSFKKIKQLSDKKHSPGTPTISLPYVTESDSHPGWSPRTPFLSSNSLQNKGN